MDLKILCVGDVVGGPGRRVLREALPKLIPERQIDCVIVNAENAAAGSGLTQVIYTKIIQYGVNLITLGDHIYRRRDIIPVLETSDRIVRPANLPTAAPGKEFAVQETASNHKVAVISLLGRLFMKTAGDCPFAAVDRVLAALPGDVKIIVVDMHAEATSEKIAMGRYLDGRVTVVVGTHTHVPTADAQLLPEGTAFVTDVGMVGAKDSIIGVEPEAVIGRFLTGMPARLPIAEKSRIVQFNSVLIDIDESSGRALSITRVDKEFERDGL